MSKTLFAATVVISVIFIAYTTLTYFNVFTITRKVSVSLLNFNIKKQDSQVLLETMFLLQNPTAMDLKIVYIREVVYVHLETPRLLAENFKRAFSGYVIKLSPFSNETLTLRSLMENLPTEFFSSEFSIMVYIRVVDVPLIGDFTLKEYFYPVYPTSLELS